MVANGIIRIDVEKLSGLASRIATLQTVVIESVDADFRGASRISSAYNDFVDRWDENREKLFTNLDAIRTAIETVRDSFETTDGELASSLENSAKRRQS